MANVLVIETSFKFENSNSRILTHYFLQKWHEKYPNDEVKIRDLALNPIPHIDNNLFGVWNKSSDSLSEEEQISLRLADEIIAEVQNADVLVIGAPLYNFNIASVLKAWLENLLRSGVTFKYTPEGPEGLVIGKKVFIITTSGWSYGEGEGSGDFQTPYLRYVLNFIGITDITFIKAQGLTASIEACQQNIQQAKDQINQVLA